MNDAGQVVGRGRVYRWAALAGLALIALLAVLPSSASAAACPLVSGSSTEWIAGSSGSFNEDLNWSNGGPSPACDAIINKSGTYTVTMTAGSSMKSLTFGGPSGKQTLVISAENPNTNLSATTTGVSINPNAAVVLTCPALPTGCNGGPGGGPGLNALSTTITNEGSITVAADAGTGTSLTGGIVNTGTMQFNQSARHTNGTLVNQGPLGIADGKVLTSSTSHCGDSTGTVFKNDAGGQINAAGSGTLDVFNYEQGDGITSGVNPVQMPCGSLKYSGDGASTVRAYGGFSLTGAMQADQSLTISAESSNTNASLASDFVNNGSITLTCPGGGCNGGAGGGPGFNAAGKSFTNAGTFSVAAAAGTGTNIGSGSGGTITNNGTMAFNQSAALSGVVVNQGPINIADGKTVASSGSSCGDAGASIKNNTGGQINASGTGTLNLSTNYDQGAGTTSGTNPVQMACGNLKYSGSGASTVRVYGGFSLTGAMQPGQSLTISAESSNTNATLTSDFLNNGSITLTCPAPPGECSGGSGGGPGFNAAGKSFINAGTFTVAAAAGTGTGLGSGSGGMVTNTGTMNFNQSAGLGGVVVNKGAINIADGKTATSSGSSCGDTGSNVKNDTGGSINAIGSGTLSVYNYEQGAGTTSGSAPVQIPCGSLKYSGTGSPSVVQANGASMTGNIASGQTLRVVGGVNAQPFTNAGTVVLDQSAGGPTLNVGGTLTNTGTIMTSGPSVNTSSLGGATVDQTGASAQMIVAAGTNLNVGSGPLALKAGRLSGGGTLNGTVNNIGGLVAPGASAGTLTVSGNYTQGAGGNLEIEVEGTGAGQFDKLAVGGSVTLGGTLALRPSSGYAASSAVGDSVEFLTYGGSRTDPFGSTTVNPSLACPKQFTTAYDDGPKKVSAVVSNSGAICPSTTTTTVNPPPPVAVPKTTLKTHPGAKVKTKKTKVKVTFTFSSDVGGAKFECKLDNKAFASCASPKSYKVKSGKHKFSVRAVGPGGTDATPASFSFKVVKKGKAS